MIQRAKELQMIAILRVFLIDSMAFDAALGARNLKPDAIDILPGLMPSMIRKVRQMTGIPVLTAGSLRKNGRSCRRSRPVRSPFPAPRRTSGRCEEDARCAAIPRKRSQKPSNR